MLNRFVFCVCMLAFSLEGLAQKTLRIDSLESVLKQQVKTDSNRVKTLNALVRQHWIKGNYKVADSIAVQALTLSKKIQFITGTADALYGRGVIMSLTSERQTAMDLFHECLKFSQKNAYDKGIANAYNGLTGLYYTEGKYTEAMKIMYELIRISKQNGDRQGLANYYNNIALVQSLLGLHDEAIKNNYASLRLKEQLADNKGIASSFHNIGLLYMVRGDYNIALKNFLSAIEINKQTGNKRGQAENITNMAKIYLERNDFDRAHNYCSLAMKLHDELGSKQGRAYSLNIAGEIKQKKRLYHEALEEYMSAIALFDAINDKKGLACARVKAGDIYYHLKQYDASRNQLQAALETALSIGAKEDVRLAYFHLARLDSAAGRWEYAYKHQQQYMLYKDSVLNESTEKKLTEATLRYEFSRREDSLFFVQQLMNDQLQRQKILSEKNKQDLAMRENQLSLLNAEAKVQSLELNAGQAALSLQKLENEKVSKNLAMANNEKSLQELQLKKQTEQRNFLLIGFILLAALAVLGYIAYTSRQKLKMQTLRNKIASDLHDDVGSTLSSISIFSQMMQEQSKEVNPMLQTITESSRKMLDAMADIVWTINPENDNFEKILLRMRSFAYEMLGAKNIDFEFIAGDDVSSMNLLMETRKNLYLIFKEAVNNMIKYSEANKAVFSLTHTGNVLTMLIKDNGKGFNPATRKAGNGLNNIRNRAEEINGKLVISSFPGEGTSIELKVAV